MLHTAYIGRATLGSLQLKDGSEARLHLRPPAFMTCEGELTLELTDASDRTLYRLVMTVIDDDTLPSRLRLIGYATKRLRDEGGCIVRGDHDRQQR